MNVVPEKVGIRFGQLGPETVHLCVDMQKLFAEGTPWGTPWLARIVPAVVRLCEHAPADCAFTRFIPVRSPADGTGAWRRYYERWKGLVLEKIDPDLVELIAPLQQFAPPAPIFDKWVYSPWWDGTLHSRLQAARRSALVISGGEAEICVLATVLSAIDLGYRVVLASDALCSSADETYDAISKIFRDRYGMQVETATVEEICDAWRPSG